MQGVHRSGILNSLLLSKKTGSEQTHQPGKKEKKTKRNLAVAASSCEPQAITIVHGLQEQIQHKYQEMLTNKNRHIDNFILKQRRLEQTRADKLDKIEMSYREQAENGLKLQKQLEKQNLSYHIDLHGKCTFIEKIKYEKLP